MPPRKEMALHYVRRLGRNKGSEDSEPTSSDSRQLDDGMLIAKFLLACFVIGMGYNTAFKNAAVLTHLWIRRLAWVYAVCSSRVEAV
jgi:hypothetical protein